MAKDLLGQFGDAVGSFATTVTKDAGAFVANAQNSVAQLTGSGVNAQGKIVGPLAEHFGADPLQFTVNCVKHFDAFMRDVATRVAHRTGNASYKVITLKGPVEVPALPAKSDPSVHIAFLIARGAIEHPAILLEEAGRAQQGLPEKRGLDGGENGYVWFPTAGIGGRGFFGIDEAAAAAAALAIIVAIAPAIITALISVVGAIAPQVVSGIQNVLNPKPPVDPNAGKILGLDAPIALGAGALVIVLLIVGAVVMKHGHHAAAA